MAVVVQMLNGAIQRINFHSVDKISFRESSHCLKHRLEIYPVDRIIHFSNNRPGPWVSFIQNRNGNFDFFADAFLMNSWTELFEAWLVGGNRGLTANGACELLK